MCTSMRNFANRRNNVKESTMAESSVDLQEHIRVMNGAINWTLLSNVIVSVHLSLVITASARFIVISKFMSAVVSFICLQESRMDTNTWYLLPHLSDDQHISTVWRARAGSAAKYDFLKKNKELKSTTKKGSDYFCVIGLMRSGKKTRSAYTVEGNGRNPSLEKTKSKKKRSRFWLIIIKIQPILCGHKSISIHIYAGKWVHTIVNNTWIAQYTHNTNQGSAIGTIISIIFPISIEDWKKEERRKEKNMIFYACNNNKLLGCHCPMYARDVSEAFAWKLKKSRKRAEQNKSNARLTDINLVRRMEKNDKHIYAASTGTPAHQHTDIQKQPAKQKQIKRSIDPLPLFAVNPSYVQPSINDAMRCVRVLCMWEKHNLNNKRHK